MVVDRIDRMTSTVKKLLGISAILSRESRKTMIPKPLSSLTRFIKIPRSRPSLRMHRIKSLPQLPLGRRRSSRLPSPLSYTKGVLRIIARCKVRIGRPIARNSLSI